LYTHRKNLLDIFRINGTNLAIHREPFERVMELEGFELTPVGNRPEIWEFRNPVTGQRGRLMNVQGYLNDDPVFLNTEGRAYMITRQDFTLALLFPGIPRRIKLNKTRHKVLPLGAGRNPLAPASWPDGTVTRAIRVRFSNILILEEEFLLRQIGLRGTE
jgi:hypothetical protein